MVLEDSVNKQDFESGEFKKSNTTTPINCKSRTPRTSISKRDDGSKFTKHKSSIKEAWPVKNKSALNISEKEDNDYNTNCEITSQNNSDSSESEFVDPDIAFDYTCQRAVQKTKFYSTKNMSNAPSKHSILSRSSIVKKGINRRGLDQYFRIEPCFYSQSVYLNAAGLMSKFRGTMIKTMETPCPSSAATPCPDTGTQEKSDTIAEPSETPNEEQPPSENLITPNAAPEGTQPVTDHEIQNADSTAGRNSLTIGNAGKIQKFKPVYKSGLEKRRVYELSFTTLKYETILEKVLDEVGFFSIYPDLKEDEDLVLVIFNDYVKRKFQRRTVIPDLDNEEFEQCTTIEDAVFAMRTKLNAAIARTRIRNAVRSLEALLPEEVRNMEMMAKDMHVYAWVNYLKMPLEKVSSELQGRGYKRVPNVGNLKLESMEYTTDRHCSDLFVFSRMDKQALADSDLTANKEFIIQDKSSCMAVHCMMGNIIPNEEVAVINPTTIATAIHLESLMSLKFGSAETLPTIRIFRTHKDKDEPPNYLQTFGSKACKMFYDDVVMIDPTHEKYKSIRHVFVQAKCTRSGVINPIDFLVSEGDEIVILKDYCQRAQNPGKPTKMAELVVKNIMLVRQAIHFSKARTVTYLSNSIYEEENENLVAKALDVGNKSIMKDAEKNKTDPFWIIPPPIPVSGAEVEDETLLKGKFIRVEPNSECNGYFISLLLRDSLANQRLNNPELMADLELDDSGNAGKGKGKGGKGKKKKGKEGV